MYEKFYAVSRNTSESEADYGFENSGYDLLSAMQFRLANRRRNKRKRGDGVFRRDMVSGACHSHRHPDTHKCAEKQPSKMVRYDFRLSDHRRVKK